MHTLMGIHGIKILVHHGHLDYLVYAYTHGCLWDIFHKCPWNERICMLTAQYEHLNCLEYYMNMDVYRMLSI